MKRYLISLGSSALVLVLFWSAYGQPLKLVDATWKNKSGAPLAHQTVLIEGTTEPAWYGLGLFFPGKPIKVLAVTDQNGFVQFVDLPPGSYAIKVLGADASFKQVKAFKLKHGYTKESFSEKLDLQESLSIQRIPASGPSSP